MITATLTGIDAGESISLPIMPIQPELSRRVSRVATLDGGAVILDGGFSDSDRNFLLECPDVDNGLFEEMEALARVSGEIRLSIVEGRFVGVIEHVKSTGSGLEVKFMVRLKI